jgi:hypothetical protein
MTVGDSGAWRAAKLAEAANAARRQCGEAKPADAGARRLRASKV